MPLKPYKTLIQRADDEFIIHKSRFIGYGCPCETEEEALGFLSEIRARHKDASHNCYAYIIGPNMGVMRYSDDGEPGGTAGMPIIEVMKARSVTNCAVVVTRYFGGILLGTGGLCRAYTKAAKDALDDAGISELRPWSVLQLDCPYALFERVKLELEKRGGTVISSEYGAQIALTAALPEPEEAVFAKALQELSAGSLVPEKTGTELRGVRVR